MIHSVATSSTTASVTLSKGRMLHAALAVLLMVCSSNSSVAAASTPRALADDKAALDSFVTAPHAMFTAQTTAPVSVSIVAPSSPLLSSEVASEPATSTLTTPVVNSLKVATTTTPAKPTTAPVKPVAVALSAGSGSGVAASSSNSNSTTSSSSSDNGGYESGSGSNRTYACSCTELRKVSLMGYANYCLRSTVEINNKCGNRILGKDGECPKRGAIPCSITGYTLTQDALCLEDDDDGVFKCVLSADDLEIKKNGGKKKKTPATKKPTTNGGGANNASNAGAADAKSSSAAMLHCASPALRVVTLVASIAFGVVALL